MAGKVKAVKMWAVVYGDEVQIVYCARAHARRTASDIRRITAKRFSVIPVLVTPAPKPRRKK
jgi:hypothetical protein